jgi:hypothetical protein
MLGVSRELFEEVEIINFNVDFTEDDDRNIENSEFLDCLDCDDDDNEVSPFEWNLMDNEGRVVATMDSNDLWVTGQIV